MLAAFRLALNYNWLSIMSLCFISLAGLMVVVHPINSRFKRKHFVISCSLFGLCSSAAVVAGISVFIWTFYSKLPFNLCNPFVDPNDESILIKILTFSTASAHFAGSIFVVISNIQLVKEMKKNQERLKGAAPMRRLSWTFYLQMLIFVLCCLITWIPSSIVFVVLMLLQKYPIEIIALIISAVTPINAIVVPFLFLYQDLRKLVTRKVCPPDKKS